MYRKGKTIFFEACPSIIANASVVGKTEGEGPLCDEFDEVCQDDTLGEATFEKSESAFQHRTVEKVIAKAKLKNSDIDCVFAGDLLNQCTASTFGIRDLGIPFVGLFGACSTMALTLINASIYVESNAAKNCIAMTSSHFCSAERQFRMPLEYGGQRTPTAQRTVTGAGASLISTHTSNCPSVKAATIGSIIDLKIKDAANMGAAMAPVNVKLTPYPI